MRLRPITWFVVSLLLLVGALFLWRLGNRTTAHKAPAPTAVAAMPAQAPAVSAITTPSPIIASAASVNSSNRPAAAAKDFLSYRLSNTPRTMGQLMRDDKAILLENALVDTAQPVSFAIPAHLRAAADPGAYIVQARGPVDSAFRAALEKTGAKIVSYIPNNAYLVSASSAVAQQLSADPQMQAVLPYEPVYKLKARLLKLAMEEQPLPEGATLNVMAFPDARASVAGSLTKLGAEVLGETQSPFGPVLAVRPPAAGWAEIVRLPGVQVMELAAKRVSTTDLSRVRIGINSDTLSGVTNNWLGLTGSGVTVNVADTGVDASHLDFSGRVTGLAGGLTDTNGHGTHVAGIIAGNGSRSSTVIKASGSVTNANFRGMAPAANIFSIGHDFGPLGSFSDTISQEAIAQRKILISNNSWGFADSTYNIASASYDAAVRDSLPGETGSQPVLYVFGAGNDGFGNDDGSGGFEDTIFSPANAKNVIAVGAIEQLRNITNEVVVLGSTNTPWKAETDSNNEVADYSSRGNVGVGIEGDFGRFKPDVVAPGSWVVSTRSAQWDQADYYSTPISHNPNVRFSETVKANQLNQYNLFIPNNAIGFTIQVISDFTGTNAPVPLPIFVKLSGAPTATSFDFVRTNDVSVPPDAPLTVGASWNYAIGNPTGLPVDYILITDILTTNDIGNRNQVFSNLNSQLGPFYRYETGTSMAAPEVSGTLALMQEFFEQRLGRTNSPALMKALLINGARSLPLPYDFQVQNVINYQGWGLIKIRNSLPPALTNNFNAATSSSIRFYDQSPARALATGQGHTRNLNFNNPFALNQPLRVTLVWTDPPGNPAASIKLVNDLDLIVTNLATGEVYYGNDIPDSTFTSVWDPEATPVPNSDLVNNVENVYLPPLLGTNYSITVRAHRVNVNAVTAHPNDMVQDYALVITSGDGQVVDAMAVTDPPGAPPVTPSALTALTNSFNQSEFTGSILLNQRVGANSPLLGSGTDGQVNQWHFYVITNVANFTNAAFVTFQPPNLALPRLGVRQSDPDNATRFEADIDLYASTDPALLTLNPAAINAAFKSRTRGGTENITLSNAAPGAVYYVGVKSEDQMAAEYAFLGAFSAEPFSEKDQDGNLIVHGLPVPAAIPDGSADNPGAALVIGLATEPIMVRRVVVTNTVLHESFGDLLGNLSHGRDFAVLNNHRTPPAVPAAPGPYTFVYEDNGEEPLQHTDGPGGLQNFIGREGLGVWLLTMVDNAATATGRVDNLTIRLEPQDIDEDTVRTIQPNSLLVDFIFVPPEATNLQVCISGNTAPMDLFVKHFNLADIDLAELRTGFDKMAFINPPGGCLTLDKFDAPPLTPGLYLIGVYNPNFTAQSVKLSAKVILDIGGVVPVSFTSTGAIPLKDDAVTYAVQFVNDFGRISSMEVGLQIDHPRVSDLAITLISPSGTRVLLAENRGQTTPGGYGGNLTTTNIFPQQSAGFANANTNTLQTGQNQGTLFINYNFLQIPDVMHVYYDGNLIFDSGSVSNTGQFTINYGPGNSTELAILMNEGGNANTNTQWNYTATVINQVGSYTYFTENTNRTSTPIKFAVPPFNAGAGTSTFISGFEPAAAGTYASPAVVDGWNVQSANPATVVDDAATAMTNAGTKFLNLGNSQILRTLPTVAGRKYLLNFAYRAPAASGPVSWWRGDSTALDSADGNHGILVSNAVYGAGRVGEAFVFDGFSDGVLIGNAPNLQLQDMSIECWVKRTSATTLSFNGNNNATLFAIGTGGGGYGLYFRADGYLAFGKSQVNEVISAARVLDTNWHHVGMTKQGTTVVFYLDGVAYTAPVYNSGGYTFSAPGYIGAWRNPFGAVDNTFYGAIDEMKVYNRTLSPAEVKAEFDAAPEFDVALDFSAAGNPNGLWRYGYSTGLGGNLVLHTNTANTILLDASLNKWHTDISSLGLPASFQNPSGAVLTNQGGTGTLVMSPGRYASHPGPNGEYAVTRFTAPSNGQYRVAGSFQGTDRTGTSSDVHVFTNGVEVLVAPITGFGTRVPFDFTVSLLAGQQVDFAVGRGANDFQFDSTALTAQIFTPQAANFSSTAQVIIPNQLTNTLTSSANWQNKALSFTALANGTGVQLTGSPSGMLLDSFTLRELAQDRYYFPESSLDDFQGEFAFGLWGLEILDTRVGEPVNAGLQSWQMNFIFETTVPLPRPLPPGGGFTNSVAPGNTIFFLIDVPPWASFATNSLISSTAPLNVLFNQTVPPTNGPGTVTLLANVTSGTNTLSLGGTPPLLPGQSYYIGLQNNSSNNATFAFRVDFNNTNIPLVTIITLTNAIPYSNTNPNTFTNTDFYRFVVSSNSVRAQFEINNPSGNVDLYARKGLPLPTQFFSDYGSANTGTNDELIIVFNSSTPVPLTPGDWYLAAVNASGGPATYSIKATEYSVYGTNLNIIAWQFVTNSFCVTWNSLAGAHYVVQGRTDLTPPHIWSDISPTITAVAAQTTYCVPLPSAYHFFRIREGLALNVANPPTTNAPPQIGGITAGPGGVTLNWTAPLGQQFQVQWTPAIQPATWTTFTNIITSPNGLYTFTDDGTQTGGLGALRFYRLRQYP